MRGFLLGFVVAVAGLATEAHAQQPAVGQPVVDFGREVLPVLAKRCFQCHGPDKAEGGLRLNAHESITAKLESGDRAVVAGDLKASQLLARIVSTEEDVRMPPEGKPLTGTQIDSIKRWIASGAEWKEPWAYSKLKRPEVPQVKQQGWVKNPIDAFVLAKLEAAGLEPAPPADKIALLRRAYYDLTGLPPTPQEIDAFVADTSPDAYEKRLDQLLASPRYGEQQARHWLDLVRYADTNSFERDGKKPHSWRYRDYVIKALNADKPYDQFVREQLAGDEQPEPTADSITATGFYRLGLWDDEPADRALARYDGLDDLVSTTGQVFLGLTVNCARCHDHKIDPIPQRDYYQLVAFFNGTTNMGNGGPDVETPIFENEAARAEYKARVKALEEKRNGVQAEILALEKDFQEAFAKNPAAGSAAGSDLDELEYAYYRDSWERLPDFKSIKAEETGKLPEQKFDLKPSTRDSGFGFVFKGVIKVPKDGMYTFYLDSDDGARLTVNGRTVIEYDGIHGEGNEQKAEVKLTAGRLPIVLEYFQNVGGLGLTVAWSGPDAKGARRMLSASPDKGEKKKDKRPGLADQIAKRGGELLGAERFKKYNELQASLEKLKKEQIPVEMALSITERGTQPAPTHILGRGNPESIGEKVEPAFPSVLDKTPAVIPKPAPGAKSSGRRTVLAQWITSPENQLTSRVMANRIWQRHFGRGIVRSPNNFGGLGVPPTHPELLDWLAAEFISRGWKQKEMHKLIMTSNAYRMSSKSSTAGLAKDPSNDLFWRFDMRRLSAEELRDSILAINGTLNTQMFGPGIYPEISAEALATQSIPGHGWGKSTPEESARRSIYIHVKRSLITPMLAVFDFADTDGSCDARFTTIQPAQALAMVNGKFAGEQAVALANRLRRESPGNLVGQIRVALKLATGREAPQAEIDRGLRLIKDLEEEHALKPDAAMNYYCLMVLNLNEFVYLD